MRLRFDTAPGRACRVRHACPWANEAPRHLTVRPQAPHVAMQAARHRPETAALNAQSALRAGVESTLSHGVRRFDLRRSRDSGLTRPQLQQTFNATAMPSVRLVDWRQGRPWRAQRRKAGPFARLVPHLGSHNTSTYAEAHEPTESIMVGFAPAWSDLTSAHVAYANTRGCLRHISG